jgi:hypothetical protein
MVRVADAVPALADLTPEWLTALLRKHGHDVTLARVDARPIGTGQVGATYRVTLDYAGEAGGAPPTLVAKLPSNDPLSRATGKSHLTYIRESRFYQHFAGRKPMAVPDHLFIAFDDDSHDFALIMHDLPNHVQGNQLVVPSRDEAALAMDAAASIHAAWWNDPMLDTLDWLNGTRAVPPALDVDALYAMFWPAFCDRYGDRVTPDMRRVGDAFLGRIKDWSTARDGPRCLTHNDFRPDNMLFAPRDPEKPIVIVDWQTVGVGTGVGDIAYYMGTAFDPATRAAEEQALLGTYRDALIARGVPGADLTDLWDVYRGASFAGFLMGATAAMVVVQTDRGDAMFLAMCDRSAAMVLDHAGIALPA